MTYKKVMRFFFQFYSSITVLASVRYVMHLQEDSQNAKHFYFSKRVDGSIIPYPRTLNIHFFLWAGNNNSLRFIKKKSNGRKQSSRDSKKKSVCIPGTNSLVRDYFLRKEKPRREREARHEASLHSQMWKSLYTVGRTPEIRRLGSREKKKKERKKKVIALHFFSHASKLFFGVV